MLSSIHPFGERSRNNTFARTATAHVIGSVTGGATLGLLVGALGFVALGLVSLPTTARLAILVVAAATATLLEATNRERLLPTRTRQVNENWLQNYRGWVYGGGWGAELGFGVSTIITTALIHILVLTMLLSGNILAAVLLGATFGFVRGATVFAAYQVDSPERLRLFHQNLDRLRERSRIGSVASLAIATTIGTLGLAGLGGLT